MLLRNFPLNSGRPRGREETNNYVQALDLKNEADQVAQAMIGRNGSDIDLNPAEDAVVLNDRNISTGANISWADVTGVAVFQGSQDSPESVFLQADIDPDRGSDRTLSKRTDGDVVRYSRQFHHQQVVEHMVHDTATDTFNYFKRDPQGHFLPKA